MKNDLTYNVYCDESCHIEHDHMPVMVLGGIWCNSIFVQSISKQIKKIKAHHGIPEHFEIKWTKISPAKIDFYIDIISFFVNDNRLMFRGLVVPDKQCLDHKSFRQTHDDWYYKMYYAMLKFIINSPNKYNIYMDIKDTHGGSKTSRLHEILAHTFYDFDKEYIQRVQQIRSHESYILQVTDLIIGSIGYANRQLSSSNAKNKIVKYLENKLWPYALTRTSSFGAQKFNILVWNPRENEK